LINYGAQVHTSAQIERKNGSGPFPEVIAPYLKKSKMTEKREIGLTLEPEGLLKPTLHQNVKKN
jgi:hypothetical protein